MKDYYTVKEILKKNLLPFKKRHLRNIIWSGELESEKMSGKVLIPKTAINIFIRKRIGKNKNVDSLLKNNNINE